MNNNELIARLRTRFKNMGHMLDKEVADALEAAHPAPQVPMTEADISELYYSITKQRLERLANPDSWVHKFARAVEAHHKIGVKP